MAELRLPEDDRVTIEKTGTDEDHYTVWGDESLIRQCVVRVVPIVEDQNDV